MNMTKLYNEINKADANVTKSNVISWRAVCVTANITTPEQNPTKKEDPNHEKTDCRNACFDDGCHDGACACRNDAEGRRLGHRNHAVLYRD